MNPRSACAAFVIAMLLGAAACSSSSGDIDKPAPKSTTSSVQPGPQQVLASAVTATEGKGIGWYEVSSAIPSHYFEVEGFYDLPAREEETTYRQAVESNGVITTPEFHRTVVSDKVYVKDEALSTKPCWFEATDWDFYNPPEIHAVEAIRLLAGLRATRRGSNGSTISATVAMSLVRDALFGAFGADVGIPAAPAGAERLRMPVTVEIEDGVVRNVLLHMEDAVSIVKKSDFTLRDVFGKGASPTFFKELSLVGIAYDPGEPGEIAAPPTDHLGSGPKAQC